MNPKVLVVLLSVVHGPTEATVARAAADAIRATAGEGAGLADHEVSEAPTRQFLDEAFQKSPAVAVVVLECKRPACARVSLQVIRRDGKLFKRTLAPDARDPPEKRGRAAGAVVNAQLPEAWRRGARAAPDAGEHRE
jgi:hypothetical protein